MNYIFCTLSNSDWGSTQPWFLCRQTGFNDVKLNPALELHMWEPYIGEHSFSSSDIMPNNIQKPLPHWIIEAVSTAIFNLLNITLAGSLMGPSSSARFYHLLNQKIFLNLKTLRQDPFLAQTRKYFHEAILTRGIAQLNYLTQAVYIQSVVFKLWCLMQIVPCPKSECIDWWTDRKRLMRTVRKEVCKLITRIMPCGYLSPFCGYLLGEKGCLVHAQKLTLRLVTIMLIRNIGKKHF